MISTSPYIYESKGTSRTEWKQFDMTSYIGQTTCDLQVVQMACYVMTGRWRTVERQLFDYLVDSTKPYAPPNRTLFPLTFSNSRTHHERFVNGLYDRKIYTTYVERRGILPNDSPYCPHNVSVLHNVRGVCTDYKSTRIRACTYVPLETVFMVTCDKSSPKLRNGRLVVSRTCAYRWRPLDEVSGPKNENGIINVSVASSITRTSILHVSPMRSDYYCVAAGRSAATCTT